LPPWMQKFSHRAALALNRPVSAAKLSLGKENKRIPCGESAIGRSEFKLGHYPKSEKGDRHVYELIPPRQRVEFLFVLTKTYSRHCRHIACFWRPTGLAFLCERH
jgi:hypothetical protein